MTAGSPGGVFAAVCGEQDRPVWGRLPSTGVRSCDAHSAVLVAVHREKRGGDGGADRDRTDDLRLAKPALSQLSYSPTFDRARAWWAWEDLNFRPHAYQACALTN